VLVQKLIDLVTAGGGALDTGAVLAKLDEVQANIVEAANTAGAAAAGSVLETLRRAAAAEAASLGGGQA